MFICDTCLNQPCNPTDRVKSIISPNESLTPGLLYVGVATLTGSILSRNRFILTRFILPPAFLVASAHHFLPQTTHNLSAYLGSLEDAYLPTVAEKHDIAKAHSSMAWERLKEATADARAKANSTALRSVERVQGATGLKIKETLGLGKQAAKKWERKVVETAHVAGDEVERVVKAPYVTDAETARLGQQVRDKVAGAIHDAEKEGRKILYSPFPNTDNVEPNKKPGLVQAAEKEVERVANAPYVNDVETARLGQQVRDKAAGVVHNAEQEVKRVVDAPYVTDEETRRLGEQAREKVAETVRDAEKEVEKVVDAPYTTPEEQKKAEDLKDKDLPKLV